MRQKLAIKSSVIGLVAKLLAMVLSIISARLFVYYLGIEIKGINGLLSNILSLLKLAEMGIGTAIIYALYQPIVDKKVEEIKSLMYFYKKAYRAIGFLVLFIGSIVSLFLKFIIEDSTFSWVYIYIVFFFQLFESFSTYMLGAYKRNLLYADQQQYVATFIDAVANTIFVILRMGVIVFTQSYLAYLALQLFQTIVSNIAVGVVVDKKYPYLKEKDVIQYDKMPELLGNVKNVIAGRIGGLVYNSTDNIIISKTVGIIAVGYMTNYYMIRNLIKTLTLAITDPIRPMIGNYIREYEDIKKTYQLFLSYTFVRYCIANIVVTGVIVMLNPFIDLVFGKGYTLSIWIPILLAVDLYIDLVHTPAWEYMNVLGLFKNDRNISYIGAAINLITSIILSFYLGISGVLLGTIIAQMYYWIARISIIFKYYFKKGLLLYIKRNLIYIFVTITDTLLVIYLSQYIISVINPVRFLLMGSISVFVSVISICILWRKTEEFELIISILKKIRLHRVKKELT